jgi:hypothetical protein
LSGCPSVTDSEVSRYELALMKFKVISSFPLLI